MEILHKTNQIINHRYQLLKPLGEGSSAITYQAQDLETGEKVALKVLSLRHLDNWQKVELFEKEAKILQQLNCANIPQYLEYFESADSEEQNFYLVEQLAPGKSLVTLVEEGWLPDEETVKKIASQLLEILIYLQGLMPPVIHRDIKPQNIIYNNGEIFLVDFGTVQETYRNTITASIAIGTPDYMAPEQMSGKANLNTDLYGLGMTLLFLLTGKSPLALSQNKLKIDFRKQVEISKDFATWLDKMIEPKSGDRFANAQIALNVLQTPKSLQNHLNWRQKCGSYTSVSLSKTEDKLLITMPPAFLRNHYNRFLAFGVISWYVILFFNTWGFFNLNRFVGFSYVITILLAMRKWGRVTHRLGLLLITHYLMFYLLLNMAYSYPSPLLSSKGITVFLILTVFINLILGKELYSLLLDIICTTRLEITKREFCLSRKFLYKWFMSRGKDVENLPINYEFGTMLNQAERLWLKEEIDNFLATKS